MYVTSNTTGMVGVAFPARDIAARDVCVVVIKGTFNSDANGVMTLAAEQRPLISTDEHYGDPSLTSVREECDFVFNKMATDVIVVGKAVAPDKQPVHRRCLKDLPQRHLYPPAQSECGRHHLLLVALSH